MPSQINNEGNVHNVTANYLKTAPTTRFGTRQIQRVSIYTTADTTANYLESNSLYSQLVRALQQNVELYAVHMPNPSFFTCWGAYCFQVDIAYDTANDNWNAANSFVDDGDPVNWYFGPANGAQPQINPNSNGLNDVISNALDAAGEDDYCYVMITWTVGDMTWPTNNTTVPGGDTPMAPRTPDAAKDPDLAVMPGDTADTRLRKLAKWIKSLNS